MNTNNKRISPAELTRDTLFDGQLICYQHRKGYRFSVDAVLLAHFVDVRHSDRVLDLGGGCGVIGLILLYRHRQDIDELCTIELQQELAALAERNMSENGYDNKATVVHGDIRKINTLAEPESFDSIVCNPPFYAPGSGRKNTAEQARLARHQIAGGLEEFLRASRLAVKNRGSVYFIYPADQLCELIHCAALNKLEVKRMRLIYSYPETLDNARLVLVHCVKNGGVGVQILPPFYIYNEKNGDYSQQMQSYYESNSTNPPEIKR